MERFKLLLFFLLFVHSLYSIGQDLDLASNYGWASKTIGGKGGRIIKVTNLNKTGRGSFFEALRTPGKRTVVFEVGGTIDLNGILITIKDPYLTVLGQSAPSPGITIINGGIGIKTHDVIIQHLRIRTGSSVNKRELDVLTTAEGAYNVIVDHCSLAWAVDENLSASGPQFKGSNPDEWRRNTSHNITFSNNIIGEALSHSVHRKGEHSMGTLVHDNVTNILIMRNLYVSNNDRNALFKGGTRGIFLNNYIFNPGVRAIWYGLSEREWGGRNPEVGYLSVIGNVLRLGRDSDPNMALFLAKTGPLKLYLEDNRMYSKNNLLQKNEYRGDANKLVKQKPIWVGGLKVLKSSELENYILKNVGARPWDRDFHDNRILSQVKGRSSRIINSEKSIR